MRRTVIALVALAISASGLVASPPAQADPAPAPVVGECTNDPSLTGWVLAGTPVPCTRSHTGQTIMVGTWTSDTPPSVATRLRAGSTAQQRLFDQLGGQLDSCSAAADDLVGVSRTGYQVPTAFTTNATGPNNTQWAAGQRWLRCDLVVQYLLTRSGTPRLGTMPAPRRVPDIMRTPIRSNRYAVCGWLLKTRWGSLSCFAPAADYLLPAFYAGRDLVWPGTGPALESKVTVLCKANRTVRSITHDLRRISMWSTGSGPITRKNYKSRGYYCAVKRR